MEAVGSWTLQAVMGWGGAGGKIRMDHGLSQGEGALIPEGDPAGE